MRAASYLACGAVLLLAFPAAADVEVLAASGCTSTIGASGTATCFFLCQSGTAGVREFGVSGYVFGTGHVFLTAKMACGVVRGTTTVGDVTIDGVQPELFATECSGDGDGSASCDASGGLVYLGVPMQGMCRASGTPGAWFTCYVA
ncbi:MAG TPA: hypothetical protein VI997_06030 [Candidatus Thermoplasmatota archaeon]|nr:hypothetical protein [Candidatus Thermoplasmatota archaeon]